MWNWIIPQHCNKIEPFKAVLEIVRDYNWVNIDQVAKDDILYRLEMAWLYKPLKWKFWLWTAGHKIDEPHFYWWLYVSWNKLHVSNYWMLLLENRNNDCMRRQTFCSMLFSIQYPNLSKTSVDPSIQLYPFRILLKYLLDFWNIDVVTFALFFYKLKTMKSEDEYKTLVDSIKQFQWANFQEQLRIIKLDSIDFIKNYVSATYCFNLLSNFWILEISHPARSQKIQSPNRAQPTNVTNYIFKLKNDLKWFVKNMLEKNSMYEEVKLWELKVDLARRISNYVAPTLLQEITKNKVPYVIYKWMTLPEDLIESSINSDRWKEFENNIVESFNIFSDIKAEAVWWPSEPDVVCKYTDKMDFDHIFTSDAKSTKKKLNWVPVWRITWHMKKYWWEFAIVITPKWVPSAEIDITDSSLCLLSSYAFSELVKLWISKQIKREDFSFEEIYKVIKSNLWNDITNEIYNVIDKYSWVSQKVLW